MGIYTILKLCSLFLGGWGGFGQGLLVEELAGCRGIGKFTVSPMLVVLMLPILPLSPAAIAVIYFYSAKN